jgi:hypothetical protein
MLMVRAQVLESAGPLDVIVCDVVVAVGVGQGRVVVLFEIVVIRHRHLQVSSPFRAAFTQAVGRRTQESVPAGFQLRAAG